MPNLIRTIVHPTDFSDLSMDAFAHALRIALAMKCRLYLVHIGDGDDSDESAWFPHVRQTLAQWKLLDENAPRSAVEQKLGIKVAKLGLEPQDPLRGLLSFLDSTPTDLLVLATHGRDGIARWLQGSIAETLSRQGRLPTLFVSSRMRGFVEQSSGQLSLRRVLMPIDHEPGPGEAFSAVRALLRSMDTNDIAIDLLHIGESGPRIRRVSDGAIIPVELGSGDVVGSILKVANDRQVDLIAMPTVGHHGFLDALRGSTTERVPRLSPCPVLAMPSG